MLADCIVPPQYKADDQHAMVCFHREPDFSAVRPGVRVLVKCDDNLWHRAVVLTSSSKTKCEVKLELSGKTKEADLHCVLPLGMFDVSSFCKIAAKKKRCRCRICIVLGEGATLY
jgi:hypothetical protein